MEIKAADVAKLRKMTGAGMMDSRDALREAKGDFALAKDIIRKKGQLVADKRSDREAAEGVVAAKVVGKNAYMVALACETDFVAKNQDFIDSANQFLEVAIGSKVDTLEALMREKMGSSTVEENITDKTGVTGEKIELPYFGKIEAEMAVVYVHSNKKLGSIVGFNKTISQDVAYDIAMQVAAMSPISISEADFPKAVLDKERELGREQAKHEGKPEAMLDKIAEGKLRKFLGENTLLGQSFVKDAKITVADHLKAADASAKVVVFKRFALGE